VTFAAGFIIHGSNGGAARKQRKIGQMRAAGNGQTTSMNAVDVVDAGEIL
jgi:hypothetical protein